MRLVIPTVAALLTFASAIAPAQSAYKEIEVSNGASITGKVSFSGEVPSLKVAVNKDVAVCCAPGETAKVSPRLVVGADKGVKNIVVFLKEVKAGKAFPKGNWELDQKQCTFEPHVMVVPAKSDLKIKNGDPVLHNVHGYLGNSDVFNLALPNKDEAVERKLRRSGIMRIQCDAGHTWMSAHIFVTTHPYYAVTDEKGQFKLDEIPPGKYTLTVWHENWKPTGTEFKEITLDVPIELKEKSATELNFALKDSGSLVQEKQ